LYPLALGSDWGLCRDALPVAERSPPLQTLITHPNVLNGALYWPLPNAFYVEGYGLDQFAAQRWGCAQSIKTG